VPEVGSIDVIAVEDLVCERLALWAATGHYDSWAQAVRLARNDACDQERLEHRALDLKLDQYLLFGLWLEGEVSAGRGDRSEVAHHVHSLNTSTAAAVIAAVLRDRACEPTDDASRP